MHLLQNELIIKEKRMERTDPDCIYLWTFH